MGDLPNGGTQLYRWIKNERTKKGFNFYHKKNRKEYLIRKRSFKYFSSSWYLLQGKQYWKVCSFFLILSDVSWKGFLDWGPQITAETYHWCCSSWCNDLSNDVEAIQSNIGVDIPIMDWRMPRIFLTNLSSPPDCRLFNDWPRL